MGKWIFFLSVGLLLLGPPLARTSWAAHEAGADRLERDRTDRVFEDVQKQLKELLKELERLEKKATEKLRKEVIPLLKKEIERLRKWLREFQFREKEKPEPVWTRGDGHRRAALPMRTAGTS